MVLERRVLWVWMSVVLLLGAVAGGCATLPTEPANRSLYVDLRRIIESRQRIDWVLDRHEFSEATPTALRSVCQATPEARAQTADWIRAQREALGGTAKEIYAREGKDLDAAHEALTLERTQGLLEYVAENAERDCPFWLEPDPEFSGVHSSNDRFTLILESRGQAGFFVLGDKFAFGGGGGGRLLPAWGVNENFTMAMGLEFGGSGLISAGDEQEIDAIINSAVPLLFRWYDLSRVYDLEVSAVTFFTTEHISFVPGGRVSFATGLNTPRAGAFMPVGVLQFSYELHPERGVFPVTHLFSVGTRVGFELDF